MRIGIVGAGIAGLACAEALARSGHEVLLFDKGRGPGGRMSTRRITTAPGEAAFDHGAQYFTVRDDRFAAQVRSWVAEGVVAPWPAAGEQAYVGVPGMNSPVRQLAGRHRVRWSSRVAEVHRRGDGWWLHLDGGEAVGVDGVVIAVPAEQAADLLAAPAPDLAAIAAGVPSDPCWTVMTAFADPVGAAADCWRAADDSLGALGWAARNSAKPGRGGPESWVAQATPEWSRLHLEADPGEVTGALLTELATALGSELPPIVGTAAHRWRFARCAPDGPGPLWDPDRSLGLCGDWTLGPRVESAWLSGTALADLVGG